MPRKTRINAPKASHHIIVRGIEHRGIFSDDEDRDNRIIRIIRDRLLLLDIENLI